MQAYKKRIDDIFPRNKLLEIPFYQRAYVWGEEEWERLLDDLKSMCEGGYEHFLGSVILKDTIVRGENEENFAGKFIVVDGQQRLTTLIILMKVISLLNDDTAAFESYFFTKDERRNFEAPSLRHNFRDRDHFETILNLHSLDELKGDNNVIAAYEYFRKSINPEDAELMDIRRLARLMSFVMITVDDTEDEQQIFDTINSLGVRLTTAELLKNYFFSSSEVSLYNSHWRDVFEEDETNRAYWDQEITTGRLKRSLVDIFFDCLLQILVEEPGIEVKEADRKSYEKVDKLFHSYRHFIETKGYRNKQYVLDAIKPYAERFRTTFNPDQRKSVVGGAPAMDRMNVIIFDLQNSTLIPYILYLRGQIAEGDPTFDEMLRILEAFTMRRVACRGTTKNYNRFFNGLIREGVNTPGKLLYRLAKNGDASTAYPSDEDLARSFHEETRLSSLQARGIVYLLETAAWPEASSTTMLGFDTYSLEHLMPKKWRNHWGKLEDESEQAVRDHTLLTLGNLAVIPQKLNGSISDSDWPTKKAGSKRSKGLSACASGLPSLVEPLASEVWNEELIYKRAEELLSYAESIWGVKLPAVDDDDDSTVNVDESIALHCEGNGAYAMGYKSAKGMTVMAGSSISDHVAPSLKTHRPWNYELRNELLADGTIVDCTFARDYEFRSFTAAADVVLGSPSSGQEKWLTDEGKQLREL